MTAEPNIVLGYDINNPAQSAELLNHLKEKIDNEGVMPKDALEFTDQMMEDLYQMAYHLYNSGKIGQALDIFRHLMILDFKSYRYAFGAGACCHQLEDYPTAIIAYTTAFLNDLPNPTPLYYGADCWMELGEWEAANDFYEKVILIAGNKPEYAAMKENAKLTKKGLQKKLAPGAKSKK
jgi:type III secretion system low calcium response chaperone LcrH/SycD